MLDINILDFRGSENEYSKGIHASIFSELTGENRTFRIHRESEVERALKELSPPKEEKEKEKKEYNLICVRSDKGEFIPDIIRFLESNNLNVMVLQYDFQRNEKQDRIFSEAELCDFIAKKYKLDKK